MEFGWCCRWIQIKQSGARLGFDLTEEWQARRTKRPAKPARHTAVSASQRAGHAFPEQPDQICLPGHGQQSISNNHDQQGQPLPTSHICSSLTCIDPKSARTCRLSSRICCHSSLLGRFFIACLEIRAAIGKQALFVLWSKEVSYII